MKPIQIASKTTTILNVKVDVWKIQSKKGLNIDEGASGSSISQPVTTLEPKGKGKFVHTKPTKE